MVCLTTSAMTLPLLIVFLLPGELSSFFLQKQMLKKQLQLLYKSFVKAVFMGVYKDTAAKIGNALKLPLF